MRKNKLEKIKGRRSSGGFLGVPSSLLQHENYIGLSSHAVKLLFDLGAQYNGGNNGDLCATWSLMRKRGWKSQDTLYKALKELLHAGFIINARQGGRHRATLYALTWKKIDECKLDISSTIAPPADWVRIKNERK